MADMERDLRNMMKRTADGVHNVLQPDRGLIRRAHLRRARTTLFAGAAAAALVLGGFAAARSLSNDEALPPANTNEIDGVKPTPTTPTPGRNAMLMNPTGPGRYFVDPDGDDATPLRVTFQGAEGWSSWFGAFKYLKGEADGFTGLSITTVSNLVGDACRDHTALDPPVGPTVDDLATALSRLEPFEVTAPPTDVTLFGYQGKHLELKVPALKVTGGGDASLSVNVAKFTDCVEGELHSWISPINEWSSTLLGHSSATKEPGVFNAYQVPGQTEEFWILDVEGTRVVLVNFDTPQSPAADVAERNAMFDSIRIEP